VERTFWLYQRSPGAKIHVVDAWSSQDYKSLCGNEILVNDNLSQWCPKGTMDNVCRKCQRLAKMILAELWVGFECRPEDVEKYKASLGLATYYDYNLQFLQEKKQ